MMKEYLGLLRDISVNGYSHEDRTGTGRRSIFGAQLRFNMKDGFPLVTTRKIFTKALIAEMLWFISGSTDNNILNSKGVHIWDSWAVTEQDIENYLDEKYDGKKDANRELDKSFMKDYQGEIGPMYGYCWRHGGRRIIGKAPNGVSVEQNIDQLKELITGLKENPFSSRHIVTAWLPEYIPAVEKRRPQYNVFLHQGCLAPCHMFYQCFVKEKSDGLKYLSLQMYQRSADVPVGVPYNIAQYALLLHMLAQVTDMVPDELIITFGDAHIYLNQLDLVKEQISRVPRDRPKLSLHPDVKDIFKFTEKDIIISDYTPDSEIKYPVSI